MDSEKKPRVLLVNDHVHFGGGGDAVLNSEREYLEQCGYEVFLYGWACPPYPEDDRLIICEEDADANKNHFCKFFGSRHKRLHFRKTLSEINPDIVHIHLVSKYPLAVYPELKGRKVIQTLHGPSLFCATSWGCIRKNSAVCPMGIGYKCYRNKCMSFPGMLLYSLLNMRIRKYLSRDISVWHCPSRNIYNTAFALGYHNLTYIPLGIDAQYCEAPSAGHYREGNTILFVGALSEAKGLDYLYEAYKIVARRVPDARLLIAGAGDYMARLKKSIGEDGYSGKVELLGKVPHDKIIEYYRKASVFVVPSIWQEQFGLVGPEALAVGVPVVASNTGGIPEWLHHNEWGFLVAPRDTEELAERISFVLDNPEIAYRMGQKGRDFVMNEYPYDKYVVRIKCLIDALYDNTDYKFCY